VTLGWKQFNSPAAKRQANNEAGDYHPPHVLNRTSTAKLPEGSPPVASVTDSTTRTLDEVFVEARK
jgi:hypothetical protein